MENNNFQYIAVEEDGSSTVNFSQLLGKCVSRWWWFALSVLLCLGLAALYILMTRPLYSTSATVLIKEASARRMATSDIESVMNFSGGASMSSKVVNEVIAFKSPALMMSVIDRMDLTTEYSVKHLLRTDMIYGSQVPATVRFLDMPSNMTASFELSSGKNGGCVLSRLEYQVTKDKFKVSEPLNVNYGDTVLTAIGHIVVEKNGYFTGEWKKPVKVVRNTKSSVTGALADRLKAEQMDIRNHSDVLQLKISDYSLQRANDILDMMIVIYNENWVEDKNKMAISTTNFIDERLASLEKELGTVDQDISSYKSANLIPEVSNISNIYLTQNLDNARLGSEIDNQLYICRYLKNYLHSQKDPEQLIPMATGVENAGLSSLITEYNRMVLTKNSVEFSSSDRNPLVIELDNNLVEMRKSIESTVDNQIATMEAQLSNLKNKEIKTNSKIASNPTQVKYLTTIGRQQKVKETLYLYLLQKREENELSQAFTAYNTRIITPPIGNLTPVAPRKKIIVLLALFLGLFIPFGIIFIQMMLDTKVRSRKDIEALSLPFLAEIPESLAGSGKVSGRIRLLDKKKEENTRIVVRGGKRDATNEAFRVLRTNLEFMTRGNGHNVIVLTSFNPGSGKTFLAMNIAAAVSIKKKSVLVIDGDLRHASTSEYVGSPKHGIVDYLNGTADSVDKLIVAMPGNEGLEVLPVGKIPPNPSELIGDPRFPALIAELRTKYDYILIDCPPIDIVADTQIIEESADRTIFVVRAGLLDRSLVPGIQKFYDEKRFKNISVVLNGVNAEDGSFGNYYGHYYGKNYYTKS